MNCLYFSYLYYIRQRSAVILRLVRIRRKWDPVVRLYFRQKTPLKLSFKETGALVYVFRLREIMRMKVHVKFHAARIGHLLKVWPARPEIGSGRNGRVRLLPTNNIRIRPSSEVNWLSGLGKNLRIIKTGTWWSAVSSGTTRLTMALSFFSSVYPTWNSITRW